MDTCLGVVCLLVCGVPKAVTPIWREIRVTAMAVPCRVWVCEVGDVQCGGCAMWMDLCVGLLSWLISGFVNLLSGGWVSSTSFISREITVN